MIPRKLALLTVVMTKLPGEDIWLCPVSYAFHRRTYNYSRVAGGPFREMRREVGNDPFYVVLDSGTLFSTLPHDLEINLSQMFGRVKGIDCQSIYKKTDEYGELLWPIFYPISTVGLMGNIGRKPDISRIFLPEKVDLPFFPDQPWVTPVYPVLLKDGLLLYHRRQGSLVQVPFDRTCPCFVHKKSVANAFFERYKESMYNPNNYICYT